MKKKIKRPFYVSLKYFHKCRFCGPLPQTLLSETNNLCNYLAQCSRKVNAPVFFQGEDESPVSDLKVLSNGKRGGLKVVAFDKTPFKLFTLRLSTKSVQAPSCKRPKTTQRTLFLSFEINNCFPIMVQCRRLIKKSRKLACYVVNSNIAIGSLPTLQTSHGLLALFEKIYY